MRFFCYNEAMSYIQSVIDCFWMIMEALVPLIVPILAVFIVFRLIRMLLR